MEKTNSTSPTNQNSSQLVFKMQKTDSTSPTNQNSAQLVYIVSRWGQIIGVYANFENAAQVANASITKGQYCDIITKPVLS